MSHIQVKAQAQWQLTGNANATSTNFIGTTAANPSAGQDINFKRAGVAAGLLNTTKTSFGVNSLSTPNSISFGANAGQFSSGTGGNTYIGQNAGKGQSSTVLNSGTNNTFIGWSAGSNNSTGSGNIAIGVGAAAIQSTGNNNILIGNASGCEDQGQFSNCIYIGNYAGYTECANDRLAIDNTEVDNPLIWGDFASDRLKFHGKVGIGGNTTTAFGSFPTLSGGVNVSTYNLFVKGGILTDEVRVSNTWADYVFAKDYKLRPLAAVEHFIQQNGHLPNVPSAKQVEEDGIELGDMAKIQQEKIEELTLYIIEQNKLIQKLSDRLDQLEKR